MSEGILEFHGYDVEKIEYYMNDTKNETNEIVLSPEFLFQICFNNENSLKFNIIIGARIGFSTEDRVLPYRIEVILRGYFQMKDIETSMDDKELFFVRNGSAILFPYLRSIITDITSKGRFAPIVLPTINFYQLIDKTDVKALTLSSEHYKEY